MQSFKEKVLSIKRRKKIFGRWVTLWVFFSEKTLEGLSREETFEGFPRMKTIWIVS